MCVGGEFILFESPTDGRVAKRCFCLTPEIPNFGRPHGAKRRNVARYGNWITSKNVNMQHKDLKIAQSGDILMCMQTVDMYFTDNKIH